MSVLPPFDVVGALSDWAVSARAFRRNKIPVQKKIVAAALCNSGYSYRDVASMLGGISYVAARDAYLSLVTSLPEETRKHRREIAIDGSEAVIEGRSHYVWLARDVDTGEILVFHGSPTGSTEDGARFLSAAASLCLNKPLVRLGRGSSYPRGLLNLDLYFQSASSTSFIGRIGKLFLGSS
jgi:putative transposase